MHSRVNKLHLTQKSNLSIDHHAPVGFHRLAMKDVGPGAALGAPHALLQALLAVLLVDGPLERVREHLEGLGDDGERRFAQLLLALVALVAALLRILVLGESLRMEAQRQPLEPATECVYDASC